jgi:hypothetical protein
MDWHAATGVASGVVALAATIPYMRATARREIRPSAVTWAGWGLESAIVFAAQIVSEPSWAAVLSGTGASYCGIVVVLAVRAGGLRVGRLDVACIVLGVAAIIGWQLTADPSVALALAIAGDAVLCVPTIAKTVRDPASELGWRYFVAAGAALLSVFAAAHADFVSLGWAAYLTACNLLIGALAIRAPRRVAERVG